MKKKLGRPKSDLPIRDKQVAFHLTKDDSAWLADFAIDCGFKSRSELITAIVERLVICRFSGLGAARMAIQISERMAEVTPERARQASFDFSLLRPLPALPEVEITPQEVKLTLEQLKKEYKNERVKA